MGLCQLLVLLIVAALRILEEILGSLFKEKLLRVQSFLLTCLRDLHLGFLCRKKKKFKFFDLLCWFNHGWLLSSFADSGWASTSTSLRMTQAWSPALCHSAAALPAGQEKLLVTVVSPSEVASTIVIPTLYVRSQPRGGMCLLILQGHFIYCAI